MPSLVDEFRLHCDQQRDVAPNALLGPHLEHIRQVLAFLDSEPAATKLGNEVHRIFAKPNWLLDPVLLQSFVQTTGEAQFWMLARAKGVLLERIPEVANKTPDFRLAGAAAPAPCFEVKTLSVAQGDFNLTNMDEDSYQAQLELRRQANEGAQVATAIHDVAPHGPIKDRRYQTAIIQNLIGKASNNVKRGQYTDAPTCLVLNLLLIDGHTDGNAALRPVEFGYPDDWNIRSGVFWNLAFGKAEHLVFGLPEFDGNPSVEGTLNRVGLLEEYPEIQALVLIVQPWNDAPRFYGLKRESDKDRWCAELEALAKAFFALVGDDWNDELDTNGYALTKHR